MLTTYHLDFTPSHSTEKTKFQGDTTFTGKVTGCQVHAIEKAIRLLFVDRVTYITLAQFFHAHK